MVANSPKPDDPRSPGPAPTEGGESAAQSGLNGILYDTCDEWYHRKCTEL